MCTLADSKVPNIMPHHAVFHLGLHCLLIQIRCSEKKKLFFNKRKTYDKQYIHCTTPGLLYRTSRQNSISTKRVNNKSIFIAFFSLLETPASAVCV